MSLVIRALGKQFFWYTGKTGAALWSRDAQHAQQFGSYDEAYNKLVELKLRLKMLDGAMIIETYNRAVAVSAEVAENPPKMVEILFNGRRVYITPQNFASMVDRSYGFDGLNWIYHSFPELWDNKAEEIAESLK